MDWEAQLKLQAFLDGELLKRQDVRTPIFVGFRIAPGDALRDCLEFRAGLGLAYFRL